MTAFPDLFPVPAQLSLQTRYSLSDTAFDAVAFSFQPRKSDGTPWDSSNMYNMTYDADNGQAAPFTLKAIAQAVTSPVGSTTLITGVLAAGTQSALLPLGTSNIRFRMIASDQVNDLTVAVGNINITIEP